MLQTVLALLLVDCLLVDCVLLCQVDQSGFDLLGQVGEVSTQYFDSGSKVHLQWFDQNIKYYCSLVETSDHYRLSIQRAAKLVLNRDTDLIFVPTG